MRDTLILKDGSKEYNSSRSFADNIALTRLSNLKKLNARLQSARASSRPVVAAGSIVRTLHLDNNGHRTFAAAAEAQSCRDPQVVQVQASGLAYTMLSVRSLFAVLCACSLFALSRAENDNEKPEPLQIVLFMFFGIGVGILFMQILNKIGDPVPYTVAVFIAGILFSLANKDGTG